MVDAFGEDKGYYRALERLVCRLSAACKGKAKSEVCNAYVTIAADRLFENPGKLILS